MGEIPSACTRRGFLFVMPCGLMRHTVPLAPNSAFRRVYARGVSKAERLLVLYVLPNGGTQNRLGVSVSRKVGKAVKRNRLRRLVKECYRLAGADIALGYDLVFVMRRAAGLLTRAEDHAAIGGALIRLLERFGLTGPRPTGPVI